MLNALGTWLVVHTQTSFAPKHVSNDHYNASEQILGWCHLLKLDKQLSFGGDNSQSQPSYV